jgi:hypothetical protein
MATLIIPGPDDGPTAADLAAIEAEWPVIEAELGLLDAEVRMLAASGGPAGLDWRRLRRAQRRVLNAGRAGRVLCAHADLDGAGMHWLEPGQSCPRVAGPPAGRAGAA